MKIRILLGTLAAGAALGACDSSPVEFRCNIPVPKQSAVRGDTVVLASGLRYIQLRMGTGATQEPCERAQVHYTLFLGAERLESSRDTERPITFTPGLGELIPGFEEGVMGMRVGEVRRLIVPPNLAYGSTTSGRIPPNSTIIFDIELLAVQDL